MEEKVSTSESYLIKRGPLLIKEEPKESAGIVIKKSKIKRCFPQVTL